MIFLFSNGCSMKTCTYVCRFNDFLWVCPKGDLTERKCNFNREHDDQHWRTVILSCSPYFETNPFFLSHLKAHCISHRRSPLSPKISPLYTQLHPITIFTAIHIHSPLVPRFLIIFPGFSPKKKTHRFSQDFPWFPPCPRRTETFFARR